MPKIQQENVKTVINKDGEILEQKSNKTFTWGSEPSYIKLYLQDILYLSDIPNRHSAILHELLKRSSYAGEKDGMQVIINSSLKRRIQNSLGFKNISSVHNAITELVKGKILYRADVGMYNFNPYLFGKGDWKNIEKLRTEIDYNDIKGRTFKTVCQYKNDEIENKNEHNKKEENDKKNEVDPIKDQISLLHFDEKVS